MPSTADAAPIVIGLVNNMGDGALKATERQFRDLLASAARGRSIQLRLFAFPEVPRGPEARAYIDESYEDVDRMWATHLDGLIVTGTEPRTSTVEDEPYWITLTRTVDWAREHTRSTVWSCLAAHGAVYHLDGIRREKLPRKLVGVFESRKAGDHALTAGMADRWHTPHSRLNTIPAAQLSAHGYQVLATAADAGVDLFVKDGDSLFVFVQGHPEYDERTLFLEYRRDVRRYLAGTTDDFPAAPEGYLDPGASIALEAFRLRALADRRPALLEELPGESAVVDPSRAWKASAVQLYSNWLGLLTP